MPHHNNMVVLKVDTGALPPLSRVDMEVHRTAARLRVVLREVMVSPNMLHNMAAHLSRAATHLKDSILSKGDLLRVAHQVPVVTQARLHTARMYPDCFK